MKKHELPGDIVWVISTQPGLRTSVGFVVAVGNVFMNVMWSVNRDCGTVLLADAYTGCMAQRPAIWKIVEAA